MKLYQFERETAVEQQGASLYSAHVYDAWNIGDNPNGGYLVSIAMSALHDCVGHPDPVSVTTHYLRPGVANAECEVEIDLIRTGRTLTTARAVLRQEERERLVVLAAFSDLDQVAGVENPSTTIAAPDLPPPEQCMMRVGEIQGGIELPIMSRLDVLIDPPLTVPGRAHEGRMAGWIRFKDGLEPTTTNLLLFADAFPPSPTGLMEAVGWVPTIELTVHPLARPAPGYIQAEFLTESLRDGRMIESGALWDSEGKLVAKSRQLGLVMARG